jgi:uncharacterized protein
MAKFSKGWAFVGLSVATTLAFAFGCSQSSDLTDLSSADLAKSPDLVISQVYGGSSADSAVKADYIELFNRGTADAPLAGKAIQYSSKDGLFTSSADAATVVKLVPKNAQMTVLKPGQYYLIQLKGTADLAVDADQVAAGLNLSATDGKVALVSADQLLTGCGSTADGGSDCPDGQWIDFLGYGAVQQFEGAAAASGLSASMAGFRKGLTSDTGCVDTGDNKNDFDAAAPAPRNSSTILPGGCAGAADAGADADASDASDAAADADADAKGPKTKDASPDATEAGPPRAHPDAAPSGDDDDDSTVEETTGDQPKPKPAPKAPLRNGSSSCSAVPGGTDMTGGMSALFGLALVAASFRARRKQ